MATENDFYSCCLDEVALEGLDGITLQALWVRLQRRPNFPLSLDENSKAFIWRNLVPEPRLRFCILREPRTDLVIYDRYQHVDADTGYVVEPTVLPPDTYPIKMVNKNGQRGSCMTFDTREDISDKIRLSCPKLDEAVATWGNRLVIVADQLTRERALVGSYNSTKDLDLTDTKYCILERIGRSRYLGQTTQGKAGLSVFNLTHASMFIMRKQLVQRNLITKQDFVLRCENSGARSGFLLHLPRFFVEVETKTKVLTRELCALLESKPNKCEVTSKLFSELGLRPSAAKKLITSSAYKYVTRRTVPYKDYYPDSPREEWYTKNNQMRSVRVVQLVNPYEDDDAEDDTEENLSDKSVGLFFHPEKYVYDRPRLDQAYREVYNSGTTGMTARELTAAMMATRLEVRNLQKGLITQKLVVPYKEDVGKQRVIRYFCPEFATKSDVHKRFAVEKKRMLEQPRAEPPAAKRQKKIAAPASAAVAAEQGKVAEPAATAESVDLKESVVSADNEETNEAALTEASTAPMAHGAQGSEMSQDSEDIPTCSTSAVSSPDDSVATSRPEQPTISVETYSDFWFPKVNPSSPITFPSSSEMTSRKPLQRILPSYKMLVRANRILEYVGSEKLVSDLTKLLKALQKAEAEEGSTTKLDKVSLERLLYKLCKGGYLKSVRIVMRLGDRVKELKLIGLPTITKDDDIVKVTVEQAKFKYFSAPREPKKPENSSSSPVPETDCSKMVYNPSMGRYYGSQPKFRRMHLCYIFIHYLLYTYDGVPQKPSPGDPSAPVQYQKEISWKTFVPPLTKSPSTPDGWVLFGDVLLSLPLSLFVKIVSSIRHKIEGLEEYLNDKVKCHYLIRNLPVKLRNALLFARRYIYSIHETVKRLSFVGMLTFGPQRLKEKDQVYLYLHRNLCIKDTTVSRAGYHQISTDIDYPMRHYFLETEQDVSQFWLEVENICLCTPLGTAQALHGQVIELQNLYKKPSMIEACRNREFGEEQDDAMLPGDQLGAAGFDSALFAHLKRNWVYPSLVPGKPGMSTTQSEKGTPKNAKPLQKILSYLDRASKGTGNGAPPKQSQRAQTISRMSVYYPKDPNSAPLAVPVVKGADKAVRELQSKKKTVPRKKCNSIMRVIKPRKRSAVRRPYYDDKDMAALKQMKTMRVSWSSQEDIVLLMCKVCSWFLDRHLDKMVVPFTVIRDILNERFPSLSKDKTSRACQRRLRFMLFNPATKANASVFLCEAMQDQKLVEMFHGPKPVKSDEKQWESMFRTVLDHLMTKFSKSSEERHQAVTLPDTLQELKDRYEIIVSGRVEPETWSYSEPHNIVDIHFISVAMVILASLAADDGKTSWALILYKIYEQYPDKLVRSVTARLRHNGVICRKLPSAKKLFISLNLPMLPFALSQKLRFELTRRFSPTEVTAMGKLLLELLARHRNGEAYTFDNGIEPAYTPLLATLQLMNKLTYNMEVPQAIVDFDSSMLSECAQPRKVPAALADNSLGDKATLSDKAKSLNFDTAGCNAKTSRSFLYMLRQDMTKALQYTYTRPQDCVIIKSCKIDFSLNDEDLVPGWTVEEPTDKSYALKVRNPLYDRIVCRQRACHSIDACDASWTAEELADVYRLEGRTPEDAQVGTEIYYFILKKEQLGVPYADLCNTFLLVMGSATLDFHLHFLVGKEMILQVGVTCIRYVATQHCKPWVIRSFKIPKDMRAYTSALGEQAHMLRAKARKVAAPDIPDVGAGSSAAEGEAKKTAEINEDVAVCTADNGPGSSCPGPSTSHAEGVGKQDANACCVSTDVGNRAGGRAPTTRRTRDSNSCCLKRTYYEAMTKNINIESLEKIMYIPRLWRKPDGTLNRPVFLQFLSTVLTYVLDHPGVTEDHFRNGFSRQIEPCVQTLDVLRILEQMGCIRRFFVRTDATAKCSLFSKRPQLVISDEYCLGDVICFEGTLEALVNFAAFAAYFVK